MLAYRPAAYRQYHLTGPYGIGQTFDEMLGMTPAMGDIFRLLGHGSGAWFGIYMGSRPTTSTPVRIIGWMMGTGMGIAAILDLVSLAKRAYGTHP